MEHREDGDTPFVRNKVHAVGIVAEQRALYLGFESRKLSGIINDAAEHVVELVKKPRA